MKLITQNRKATFNFTILAAVEAGLVLKGWQVKSIKAGNVNLRDAYVYIHHGEMFLRGLHIAEWGTMGRFEREQLNADIKLLVKREEIEKWDSKLRQQVATTIIPTKIFLVRSLIKVELALVKGVKKYDKRAKIKEREQQRDVQRELKQSKYF